MKEIKDIQVEKINKTESRYTVKDEEGEEYNFSNKELYKNFMHKNWSAFKAYFEEIELIQREKVDAL